MNRPATDTPPTALTATLSLPREGAKAAGRGGKYLTFFLAKEEYGLEILKVQELIGMMDITPIPRAPEYMRGVINLRGKVIPVVELRTKFEMETVDYTDETCIIVVQTQGLQMGIIVDKVSEVLDIAAGEIEDSPAFSDDIKTDYILGIGKSEDRVKLLLDIDKILSGQDLTELRTAATAASMSEV